MAIAGSYDDVVKAVNGNEQPEVNPWPARLDNWKKFSQKFHERGANIEMRFMDDRETSANGFEAIGGKRVNMFYSNTSVIKESLYNSLPKPDVSRMHKGDFENEPSRVAATIIQRALSYEVKCAPFFDEAVKAAIFDRLVPGLGTVWCNFTPAKQKGRRTIPELISVDLVYWKDFIYEPARAWEQITWCGRRLRMDKAEAERRFGPQAVQPPKQHVGEATTIDGAIEAGKVCVIEMWDRNTLEVHFLSEEGNILQTIPDPYELLKFFPCPKPLIASPPTKRFLPLPDYYMAQDQYLGLDILYARINLIIEAVRVAGVYDSSVPSIGRMLSGTENKLIPVDNWAMFAEKGGMKGTIDWFPVEVITQVLQQLVTTYAFIKDQLFEVTGMADIVRGSSNQYETLGAQQIKAQFASVRMNGFQRDVGQFVTDVLNIMGEMVCQLYTNTKLAQIVGILPPGDEHFLPQALQIIRNDFMMHYSVSIEADSLTQADWGLEQGQRMQYAQSLSSFLNAAVPAAKENPGLAPLLIQMIKFVSVGFKGSSELESTLDRIMKEMQSTPPQQKPDPAMVKAQMEGQKMQMEMQLKQQEAQLDHAERVEEMNFKREEHQLDMAQSIEEHQLEMAQKREEAVLDAALESQRNEQEMAQDNARFEHERAQDDVRLAVELERDKKKPGDK